MILFIILHLGIGAEAIFFKQASTNVSSCDEIPGFKNLGGSCYAAIEVKNTYEKAREACKELHSKADLASIRCEKENGLVADMAKYPLGKKCNGYGMESFRFTSLDGAWIGLNNMQPNSSGTWVNGIESGYRKWDYGEPNNGLGARPETVTAMHIKATYRRYGSLGFWNDMYAEDRMCGAICEVIVKTSGSSCPGYKPYPQSEVVVIY
ncbi:unnamed protein product, partial [Mesorhabditis belari]|uniref:C-type lectin domain-containing protein n=1 Tax=Mesorhabditis belari TaxID=2138241 RepID=A0AAF3ES74_9BILA